MKSYQNINGLDLIVQLVHIRSKTNTFILRYKKCVDTITYFSVWFINNFNSSEVLFVLYNSFNKNLQKDTELFTNPIASSNYSFQNLVYPILDWDKAISKPVRFIGI